MTSIIRTRAAPLTRREELALDVAARLREAGVKVWPPGFPYAMHHRHFRTRLPGKARHWRVAEVAEALRSWGASRDDPDDYLWQAVSGALAVMGRREDWSGRLPPDISAKMDELEWGALFCGWTQKRPVID